MLSGKPGSGKSTSLIRLLLEEATKLRSPLAPLKKGGKKLENGANRQVPLLEKGANREVPLTKENFGENRQVPLLEKGEKRLDGENRQVPLASPENLENRQVPLNKGDLGGSIPILVELRYYQTSILDLICAFLQRHEPNLNFDQETIPIALRQGKFFLLIDGINELPSEETRRDLFNFRNTFHKTTPMIFTTRDLGVGGDFNIKKKLEMQPLSERQMEDFVKAYLPDKGEEMLRNIKERLREFGQTPLLLKMLCDLYLQVKVIPNNLGGVFRLFTQQYDQKIKANVPVSADSRKFWGDMLQQLAGKMMQGEKDKPTKFKVAISKDEAEKFIREWLKEVGEHDSLFTARRYLEDLLKYHLIQFKQDNPNFSEERLIEQVIENNPTLKARLINALKEGGIEALKVFFPFVSIPVETIRGFLEA